MQPTNASHAAIPNLELSTGDASLDLMLAKYLADAPHQLPRPDLAEYAASLVKPEPQPAATTPTQPDPEINLAVNQCTQAYARALKSALDHGKNDYAAERDATTAYRKLMPPLSGQDNIRDFIACVAQAMLLGAIATSDGTRLLYAAQVAYSALPSPKRRKKGRKTSSKCTNKNLPTETNQTT